MPVKAAPPSTSSKSPSVLCEMPVACSMLGMWTTHMPTAKPFRPKYSQVATRAARGGAVCERSSVLVTGPPGLD